MQSQRANNPKQNADHQRWMISIIEVRIFLCSVQCKEASYRPDKKHVLKLSGAEFSPAGLKDLSWLSTTYFFSLFEDGE